MKTTFQGRLRDFELYLRGNMNREMTLWLSDIDQGRLEELQHVLDDLRTQTVLGETLDGKVLAMGRVRVTIETIKD